MNPDQVIATLLETLERIAIALEALHEDQEAIAAAALLTARKQ